MDDEDVCPIWGIGCKIFDTNSRVIGFNSPRAGGYFALSCEAKNCLSNYLEIPNFKQKFSSYVYELQTQIDDIDRKKGVLQNFIKVEMLENIKNRKLLNFTEIKQQFFKFFMSYKIGVYILNENIDLNLLYAALELDGDDDEGTFSNLRGIIAREGLIEYAYSDSFRITSKGYEYIEMLQRGGVNSKNAFVAMWFHPETRNFYEQALKQTLIECGYQEPFRVDQKDHINKIDDEIIAMLRRARFVIVDMTSGFENTNPTEKNPEGKIYIPRGGVYYEAGFAHGLDRPVIWTCRNDCIKNLHFDIRQYNMLQWHEVDGHFYVYSDDSSMGKPGQLFKDALFNRISALNLNLNQL